MIQLIPLDLNMTDSQLENRQKGSFFTNNLSIY